MADPRDSSAPPGTGSSDPAQTDLAPEDEPVTTGTFFLTLVILMIIAAVWLIMYRRMLSH